MKMIRLTRLTVIAHRKVGDFEATGSLNEQPTVNSVSPQAGAPRLVWSLLPSPQSGHRRGHRCVAYLEKGFSPNPYLTCAEIIAVLG